MSIDTIDNFMEIAQETSKEGKLPHDIERLLKQRYYKPGENWGKLVDRVVTHVCQDDESFTETARYYLENRIWLPNSPCLFNSGTKSGGLFACFVVGPDKDTLEHHVDVLKDISVVGKRGGGCGFTGTFIREKGATVAGSAHGYAYGPNAWALKVSDYLAMITQSGQREMALMYTMRSDHPDLDEFISLKQTDDERFAYNFNQSIMATDSWMQNAIDNKNGEHSQLKRIAENSWENGDPGLLFYTTINENTPYSTCSCTIEATNPCVAEGTLVLTPAGYRKVEDIFVGSLIGTVRGAEPVEEIEVHEDVPVFKVKFSDGGEQIVTASHQYHAFKKGSDSKRATPTRVDQLAPGDKIRVSTPKTLSLGHEDDYWTGVKKGILLGDGCYTESVVETNNVIKIASSDLDTEYNENVKSLFNISRSDWHSTKSHSMNMHIGSAASTLEKLNLDPAYSFDKKIDITNVFSRYRAIGILDGLLATDGNINLKSNHPQIRWDTTSVDLAKNIRDLLLLIGCHGRIYIGKPGHSNYNGRKISGNHNKNTVYLSGNDIATYASISKLDELHPQKWSRIQEAIDCFILSGGTRKTKIESIEAAGSSTVYDLYCSGSDTWITSGYVQRGCGEQPLPSYGSCNLGSINLAHEEFFNEDGSYDYAALSRAAKALVRFLDNVGEQNVFPNQKFEDWYSDHRPIGIGVMGFADACLRQELTYGKQDSLSFLGAALGVISSSAIRESERLGKERGIPEHCGRVGRRNITVMSIAPTGSIGFIAGCSHGIEPIFSPKYQRTDERGETYIFEHPMKDEPYFVSSIGEKTPTWQEHIDVQAMTQAFVDSAVSKTVNMPHDATIDDVYNAMVYAWKKNCKGITIYRDGSRQFQVLEDVKEGDQEILNCPDGICEI